MKTNNELKAPTESFKQINFSQGLPVFNFHAAGIDVGDSKNDVAVSDGKNGFIVREYSTFTDDLTSLVNWLVSLSITTVAMESTGIYWLNLYLMLEQAGIKPYLVNAKHVKNVTGRKKDDTDAIWLQKLHSCGLLQKSFQPEDEIRVLRTYVRQRKNLIRISSDSARRMQKALELMNIKLHVVISDILGKTGLLMVKAIINGERDPNELIKLKDPRIEASDQDILKSLEGIWKKEYLFMLRQAYDEYFFYQSQIEACEQEIAKQLQSQAAQVLVGEIMDMPIKKKAKKKNQFHMEIKPLLKTILGVDLCEIEV